MSGHSKWAKIKRQKAAGDLRKGNLFTKLAHAIVVAVREGGGGDPDMNFMLRIAIDKAKTANMPKDNIERAIKKGVGEGESGPLESVTYELVGKGGVAILLDCLTDNKNRTISEIRKVASRSGFEIGSGSLGWQFEEKGRIILEPMEEEKVLVKGREKLKLKKLDKESLMLELMEIEGVEDVEEQSKGGGTIKVVTPKEKFKGVYEDLEGRNLHITNAEVVKESRNKLKMAKGEASRIKDILSQLSDLPDVNSIWININL